MIILTLTFIRGKKGGIEKKCKTCGHKWWVSKNPEKESKEPDTCWECKYNEAWRSLCDHCTLASGCTGCAGPNEYWVPSDDDDYYNQY